MEEQLYKISEASQILDMKSHVIRNWENDLGLECPRNESGHRLYTQRHIDILLTVKMLKEHGFTLKQIRLLMPNIDTLNNMDPTTLTSLKKRMDSCIISPAGPIHNIQHINGANTNSSNLNSYTAEDLRELLIDIVTNAISENIDAISREIGKNVSELVSKEMNYQLIQHENIINDRIKALEMNLGKSKSKSKPSSYLGLRSKLANLVNSDCHLS